MGKTYRHKRRLEDSTDVFDRRSKNRRKGPGRKHGKPDGQGRKRIQGSMGGLGSDGSEREWENEKWPL